MLYDSSALDSADEPNNVEDPDANVANAAAAAPRVIQQVDIVARPIRVEERRGRVYWCGKCQELHHAPLPEEVVKGGLVGRRLTALVAYLKGPCRASFSTIHKLLRDVVGVRISRGQLAKVVQKVSRINNLAEQAIRFVAIHRRITQGTRGAAGQRRCEHIWMVEHTCSQQGRSVFDFLAATIAAQFQSATSPSLLPDTS